MPTLAHVRRYYKRPLLRFARCSGSTRDFADHVCTTQLTLTMRWLHSLTSLPIWSPHRADPSPRPLLLTEIARAYFQIRHVHEKQYISYYIIHAREIMDREARLSACRCVLIHARIHTPTHTIVVFYSYNYIAHLYSLYILKPHVRYRSLLI